MTNRKQLEADEIKALIERRRAAQANAPPPDTAAIEAAKRKAESDTNWKWRRDRYLREIDPNNDDGRMINWNSVPKGIRW
jgi:hypothetical protein